MQSAKHNRATGNNKNIERIPVEIPMLAPAGVYASIADMARFVRFQLDQGRVEGRTLLTEDLVKQMQTIPFPLQDQISGYGQGLWVRYYHLGGQEVRSVEHGGGGFGYASGNTFEPLTPVSPLENMSKRYVYRFIVDPKGMPVSVVRPYDGMV